MHLSDLATERVSPHHFHRYPISRCGKIPKSTESLEILIVKSASNEPKHAPKSCLEERMEPMLSVVPLMVYFSLILEIGIFGLQIVVFMVILVLSRLGLFGAASATLGLFG